VTRTIEEFVCLGILCGASTCVGQGMYMATDLGKLPYAFGSGAVAVNDSGRIVGYSESPDWHSIAVVWAQPGSQPLPIVPSSYSAVNSWAAAINSSGQIVGYFTDRSGQEWPYLYNSNSGVFEVIGSNVDLHGGATGINQKGTVVGGSGRVFTYDGTTVTLLPPFRPFLGTWAFAINDFGDLAGYAQPNGSSDVTAVIYNAAMSGWIGFALPSTFDSGLESINDYGWAVGFWLDVVHGVDYPLVARKNGSATVLTHSGSLNAVNDAGMALGGTFAYDIPSNTWIDLNTRIVNPGVIGLAYANGISSDGRIVGVGNVNLPGGVHEQHALLLTPTPLYEATVQPPFNADGSSEFKANRGTLPVKFTLTENGSSTCTLPQASISVLRTSGATGSVDVSTYQTPADNGSNFRTDGCQYTYILGTKGLGAGDYRVDIIVNWNIVGSGEFALK